MEISTINNLTAYPVTAEIKTPVSKVEAVKKVTEETNIAVTYERESKQSETTESQKKATYENPVEKYKTDTKLIEKLKAEAEERTAQFKNLVERMFAKQGLTVSLDDITFNSSEKLADILKNEKYQVDEETAKKAAEEISEDGYWGIEKTSDRLVEFAKALSGGDTTKADTLIEATKKGFELATKAFGDELPEISKKTLDATIEKLEKWRDGITDEQPKEDVSNIDILISVH